MSSCSDVLQAGDLDEDEGAMNRCSFAHQYCDEDESFIHYSSIYYCADGAGMKLIFLLALLCWLALLFVLLGSTADDFFSPSLEQFTEKVIRAIPCSAMILFLVLPCVTHRTAYLVRLPPLPC